LPGFVFPVLLFFFEPKKEHFLHTT